MAHNKRAVRLAIAEYIEAAAPPSGLTVVGTDVDTLIVRDSCGNEYAVRVTAYTSKQRRRWKQPIVER